MRGRCCVPRVRQASRAACGVRGGVHLIVRDRARRRRAGRRDTVIACWYQASGRSDCWATSLLSDISPASLLERRAKYFSFVGGHRCRALARSRSHSTTELRILGHAGRRLVPVDSRARFRTPASRWRPRTLPAAIAGRRSRRCWSRSQAPHSRTCRGQPCELLAVGCGRCAAMQASKTLTNVTMAALGLTPSGGTCSTRGTIERYSRALGGDEWTRVHLLNLNGQGFGFRSAMRSAA